MKAQTVARSDQVAAIIRDATLPIGTHDIGRALGPWRYVSRRPECGHDDCDRAEHRHYGAEWAYTPHDVFSGALRRLERRGQIERITVPRAKGFNPNGQLYWRWIGPEPESP